MNKVLLSAVLSLVLIGVVMATSFTDTDKAKNHGKTGLKNLTEEIDANFALIEGGTETATLASGKIYVGNGSNVRAAVTVAGDVTISSSGASAIVSGVIVNADVATNAAIASSKLATDVVRSGETNAVQQLMQAGITGPTTGTSVEVVFETAYSAAPTVVICYNEDPGDVRPAFVLSSSTTNFIATVTADKDINWIAIGAK